MADQSVSHLETMLIRLSKASRDRLERRASEMGEDVETYVSELLEAAVKRPAIDELLAPVRADFAKSGMTEEQIMQFGHELLQKVRDEKAHKA